MNENEQVPPAPHVLGAETGTPFGWHYYSCFRECPRCFYYKHVLRLEPLKESAAKRRGRIFHTLKEAFYLGPDHGGYAEGDLNAYLEKLIVEATDEGIFGEFDPPQDSQAVVGNAFANWLEKFGREDFEKYDILGLEWQFDMKFTVVRWGRMFRIHLTGSIDTLMRNRETSELILSDTKTSGSVGPDKTFEHTDAGDQLTVYAAAVKAATDEIPTCAVDAILLKGRNPQVGRSEFYRTSDEIEDCLIGLSRTAEQITLLEQDLPGIPERWKYLYPRHTQKCSLWGCEYEPYCRAGVEPGQCPPGFYIKEASK